jgi:D-glycerate 3-kinase
VSEWIHRFIEKEKLPAGFMETAVRYYLPVLDVLVAQVAKSSKPVILGLNGCQGSGKTTLSRFLVEALKVHCIKAESLSIDDFYLSQDQRQHLAQTVHPLFKTRGVPGTHDIERMASVLRQIQQKTYPVQIPRFNKATDNPYPETNWTLLNTPLDVLIVEGWCWGATHQSEEALVNPVNNLEKLEDAEGKWRRYVNEQLALYYERLYTSMDIWIMLQAPSFKAVYQWREEQEAKLRLQVAENKEDGLGMMTPSEIKRFVEHYQRITERCLTELPARVDILFELDDARKIIKARGLTVCDQRQGG